VEIWKTQPASVYLKSNEFCPNNWGMLIQNNSSVIKRNYSSKGREFVMEKQYFYLKKSKPIIDQIDTVLAEHYGFTEAELDFIINYDIKYRMGKALYGEAEDDNEED
ncbi:hypothetical protein, partial [Algoriphagus faecimaris]|uniref:hypothetical protein n=1 Tax=Algoriphagus faecimaris TaxID=686796 RepID=UPI001C3198EA